MSGLWRMSKGMKPGVPMRVKSTGQSASRWLRGGLTISMSSPVKNLERRVREFQAYATYP
jgi:hypothetical protein